MTSPEWEAANEDDSDRFPQTPHTSAPESTESHERGSRVVPDPARVARYAEALRNTDNATLVETNFGQLSATYDDAARAVVAVADEERAALVAEVERLKRGGKTLGEIIDKQCRMVLDATGLHDWVDEDGDGDWGAIWDHLFALRSRAEAAEAKLAKVEALADEFDAVVGFRGAATALRAILADAPAEQRAEACADCGHLHTPDGCTGPPTPSDVWAGVSPAGCDCDAAEGDGRG